MIKQHKTFMFSHSYSTENTKSFFYAKGLDAKGC